jgi:hypothetical protein
MVPVLFLIAVFVWDKIQMNKYKVEPLPDSYFSVRVDARNFDKFSHGIETKLIMFDGNYSLYKAVNDWSVNATWIEYPGEDSLNTIILIRRINGEFRACYMCWRGPAFDIFPRIVNKIYTNLDEHWVNKLWPKYDGQKFEGKIQKLEIPKIEVDFSYPLLSLEFFRKIHFVK